MGWAAKNRISWRWVFYPARVVLALNIENVASKIGIDNLLVSSSPMLSGLVSAILSESAFYLALFLAGGGAFAWTMHIARKLDEGMPSLHYLALDCEQLAKFYGGQPTIGTKAYIERFTERSTEKVNVKLAKLGVAPVPFPDMSSMPSRMHVSQYLGALVLFLRKKDLEGARKAEGLYIKNLEAVGFVPRRLPDIEVETQP